MATRPKTVDSMDKHLTVAEKAARDQAEEDVGVGRAEILVMPASVKKDHGAKKYWDEILARMDGLMILDSLDAEVLGVYCVMLSRRDLTNATLTRLLKRAAKKDTADEDRLELLAKIESLSSKIQGQERTILSYADKLGLTPSGRVALARRRAAAVDRTDPDSDLYGDS